MRNNRPVQLRYQPNELKYIIYSDDIEELLADYASSRNLSEASRKELDRFVWQFMKFLKDKELVKGDKIGAPEGNESYVVSRETLIDYVNALMEAGYSNSSITKRLQVVILVLRRLGVSEVLIDVLRDPLRKANTARKIEQEENTPALRLEDAREFFRRLELLFKRGKLSKKRYIKAIVFALLLFSTGRRISEIAQIRVTDIDFKTHSIRIKANQMKEGKLIGMSSGIRVVFMTQETEEALRFYIESNRDEICKHEGYLFIKPRKKSLKDTFMHKIIKMSKKEEDSGANLNFITTDGLHRFELKYFRKLFIQQWERVAEEKGLLNDRILTVARKLTGHRPLNDIHRTNYAKISSQEIWEYYRELYYHISVLTPGQREMLSITEKNGKEKESKKSQYHTTTAVFEATLDLQTQQLYPSTPVAQLHSHLLLN
jgi:integrase